MDSLSGDNKDIGMTGVNGQSFLGSDATTFKTKHINTGIVFGFPLGSPDFTIDDDKITLLPHLSISLKKNFGGATTPLKFERIIHSTFTSEASIEVATSLAREKGINVNSDLKRQEMKSDRAVTIVEFAELGQANLLASKWLFLIGKNSVCIAKAVDQFRALLFILLVGTIAHNLGTFLERAGGKTCIINRYLETGNKICCAVVGFEFNNDMEFVFCIEPIFGRVKLSWTKMNIIWCEKCRKFGHSALECDAPVVSPFEPSRTFKKIVSDEHHLQLAKLYEKKSVSIFCSTAFGGKSWAQVVSLAGFSSGFHFSSGSSSSLSFFGASDSNIGSFLTLANNSFLNAYLAILECLLKLLTDQVSGILKKLSGIELVPIATPFCVFFPVTPTSLVLHLNVNIAIDDMSLTSAPSLSAVDDVVHNSSSSFSKVLTSKMGGLESKMVSISLVLENSPSISISSLVWKVAMCNLKDKVCPWIMNKFDGVQVFTSGLESGYLGANIIIIMDVSLAKHVCKVFEVSGRLISVKLLFKNKLSVMVLGLYADATLEKRLAYSYVINSIVVEALNGSTFVVLGGDFNKNDFGHSMSFRKDLDLSLGVKKCIDFILVSDGLHSSSFNQKWTLVWGASSILSLIRYADRLQKKNEDTKSVMSVMKFGKTADNFEYHTTKNDINGIWILLCQMSRNNRLVKTVASSRFYKLELLVAKILNAYKSENLERFQALVDKWLDLDFDQAVKFRSFLDNSYDKVLMAIDKYIKAFVNNKSQMIRSVLEKPFKKVTLDHLVDDRDLVLEPDLVKGREMYKQFSPFNYVNDSVFSGMMNQIDFDEFSLVVKDFLDGKAAGLFGISNEIWKHYNESVLREAWVSMIPKPYEWEEVLTNTRLIAFIETFRKILSKILSDYILRACSTHNVLCRDNFSVLKGTSTQSSIFVLILQDMRKAYDSRIKMCEKFVRFFGHIHNGHTNRIMMNFGLSKSYKVHNDLDQKEIDSKFMARTGKIEFNVGLTSYLAAGVFIDDTIWVGNCCTVTQKILNISSKFFDLIDISINTEKTVAIPINPRTSNTSLEVSRSPISITKVGEAHQYLGFGISDAVGETAAYFSDLGLHVGVEVYGLLLFTLAEMQAVALALECIPASSNVTVFFDNQVDSPRFLQQVKSHSGVLNNECADRTNLSSSVVLQSLASSVSDVDLYTVLCKSLVFEDWLANTKASFVDTKLAMSNLIKFVWSLVVGHRE
ncbi:hypothetical protein G9A89_018880 [Geosiphon pyriformis]|nr:hypothetical protein G9A89_018880 [Geosiphon pyriformis]